MPFKAISSLAGVLAGLLVGGPAMAEELVILTSFPPNFYEVLIQKFEQAHSDIKVEIVQRSTTSGVRFLLERVNADVDVFWASSPDAFELLKDRDQLAVVDVAIPLRDGVVAGYPVNDADGRYFGFAFSTFGAAYNPDYLMRSGLPVPRRWEDLTRPDYWGHIGITAPSRSGTSHFIVEAILQTYGWADGWALVFRLGGNLSTITARSFGITDGIEQGRFGLGPSIDFLATAARTTDGIAFSVLEPLFLVPASVAVLERSDDRAAAARFVEFLLSTDVQLMLMSAQLGRIPVIDELRALALASRGIHLPEPVLVNGAIFDAKLSARRYGLVNTIFDEWIVTRRQEVTEKWAAVNALPRDKAEGLAALLGRAPISAARSLELIEMSAGDGSVAGAAFEEDPAVAEEIRAAVSAQFAQFDAELERLTILADDR